MTPPWEWPVSQEGLPGSACVPYAVGSRGGGRSEIFVFNHNTSHFLSMAISMSQLLVVEKSPFNFHRGLLVHLKCCLNCTQAPGLLVIVRNQLNFTKCSTGWTLDSTHAVPPLVGTNVQKLKRVEFCDLVFVIPFSLGKSMQFSLLN